MQCSFLSGKRLYVSRDALSRVSTVALGIFTFSFANPVLAQQREQAPVPSRTITVTGRGVETTNYWD